MVVGALVVVGWPVLDGVSVVVTRVVVISVVVGTPEKQFIVKTIVILNCNTKKRKEITQ